MHASANPKTLSLLIPKKELQHRRAKELRNAFVNWCPRRDSNPEPTDYESAALTVELQGHKELINGS